LQVPIQTNHLGTFFSTNININKKIKFKSMRGISTVVATLLMLIITIALAGLAYSYISGIFTARTAVVLAIDKADCNPATNVITVTLRNDGTSPINLNAITLSGTKADGSAMTSVTCGTSGTLAAGSTATCPNTLTGSDGTNTIKASGGGSTATGTVYCA
jgi:flagellin-like protein